MNCPVCNIALTMTERQGVEIDYCQQCRGVWLDRGELDKIIERAGVVAPSNQAATPPNQPNTQYNQPTNQPINPPPTQYNQPNNQYNQPNTQYNPPPAQYNPPTHYDNRGHHYKQHDDYKYKKKKKESFLDELFDF